MPSGRDSFRRNRVAPSIQIYSTTSGRPSAVSRVIINCAYPQSTKRNFRIQVIPRVLLDRRQLTPSWELVFQLTCQRFWRRPTGHFPGLKFVVTFRYFPSLLSNNWAQQYPQAVDSKRPTSQNGKTGDFGRNASEKRHGTRPQRRRTGHRARATG